VEGWGSPVRGTRRKRLRVRGMEPGYRTKREEQGCLCARGEGARVKEEWKSEPGEPREEDKTTCGRSTVKL
jgi:hypothetical protein